MVNETPPLFNRLGGESAISAVVDAFYKRLLADARVKHFFENSNVEQLKKHQKKFLTVAFGGPSSYKGKTLKAAHAHLKITASHFGYVAEDLIEVLKEVGVADSLIEEVVAIVGSVKGDIVASPLFDRLGGEGALNVVVEAFYKILIEDSRVKHFFAKTDMARLKQHQKKFLTLAFGGPNNYTGRSLKVAHANLGISEEDFGYVAEDLVRTLKEAGVSDALIDEVVATVETVKKEVVSNDAVNAVVDAFTTSLLKDARVREFFASVDMGGKADDLLNVLKGAGVTHELIDGVSSIVGKKVSLFDRVGGTAAVSAVVDGFYKVLLEDDRVKHFFAKTDMVQLKRHLKSFLTVAFGGENKYTGKSLQEAHAFLGITEADFGYVAEDLGKVLKGAGVEKKLIDEVMTIVGSVKGDVVSSVKTANSTARSSCGCGNMVLCG